MEDIKLEKILKDSFYSEKHNSLYEVNVMGKIIDVPVKYPDGSAYMAFFPVSMRKTKDLLSTKRLMPVSIFNGKCLLGITVFDYKNSPVGPYREVALSVPVLLDSKFNIPFLPLIFDSFFKKFGYYTILLCMDTEMEKEHSKIIFGYPTYEKKLDINIDDSGEEVLINIGENGKKFLSLKMKKQGNFKVLRKIYNTYFKKQDRIINVELDGTTYESSSMKKNITKLELGDHEIVDILRSIDLVDEPIISIYYKKVYEVLSKPNEI